MKHKTPRKWVRVKQTKRFKGGWSGEKYGIHHICFVSLHLFPLLPFSCSISAAVKMDASQWREEPCSVPIALHCRKLITTLPSKITPTPTWPTLTTHPSQNLPPPQPQPQIQPQPAWQTGPVNSPCKRGKKAEQRGKMTGPQMTGVVKIVRRRKAWGQRAGAAL